MEKEVSNEVGEVVHVSGLHCGSRTLGGRLRAGGSAGANRKARGVYAWSGGAGP